MRSSEKPSTSASTDGHRLGHGPPGLRAQAQGDGHQAEQVRRVDAHLRQVGQGHGTVPLGQPFAVGPDHQGDVGVGRHAQAEPPASHTCRGVVSSRSSPRTTSSTP